jgi:hypothetical protein
MMVIVAVRMRVMRLVVAMRFDGTAPVERGGEVRGSLLDPEKRRRPAPARGAAREGLFARLWHLGQMPLYYKWPAYIGNALLLICGLIIASVNSLLGGAAVCGLAALNLYLVWKLDVFSREEVLARG